MQKKDLIKYALIAGGAYLLYEYLKSAGYLSGGLTSLLPAGSTVGAGASTSLTVTPPTNTQPAQVVTPPSNLPPSNPSIAASTNPGDGGPTGRAMIAGNGGVNSADFDTWSYFYQVQNPGAVSPALMAGIVKYGGGDRNAKITAGQWLADLSAAQASGLAGLGNLGLGDFWDFSGRSGRYIN